MTKTGSLLEVIQLCEEHDRVVRDIGSFGSETGSRYLIKDTASSQRLLPQDVRCWHVWVETADDAVLGHTEALKRCMSERKEFELKLSSGGLLGLLKIAATQTGRWKRHDLTQGSGSNRMKGEDLAWLLQARHLRENGNWVEVTDQGNALVRDVLAFAQKWEGGGAEPMSNRLFSATGAVWHCGPKHVKKTWWTTVCNVLMLLALAVLTGWLWSCVKHAALPAPVRIPGGAMAPVSQGMVIGVLISLSTMGIVLAVRKMARHDAEAAENQSRQNVGAPSKEDPPSFAEASEDPLAGPWAGVDRAEVRRILGAAIAELCEVRDGVRRARGNLSVEDYCEGLAGAEHRLHGVSLCLARLSDEFPVPVVPAKKDVEVSVGFDVGRFQESLEKARAATSRFAFMVAQRRQWVRVYLSPAADYKPSHGGYGA